MTSKDSQFARFVIRNSSSVIFPSHFGHRTARCGLRCPCPGNGVAILFHFLGAMSVLSDKNVIVSSPLRRAVPRSNPESLVRCKVLGLLVASALDLCSHGCPRLARG